MDLKEIYVALNIDGVATPVGVIRFNRERRIGAFTYKNDYKGPPLDPINLNYKTPMPTEASTELQRLRPNERTFVADPMVSRGLLHQVFVDSMTGAWGQKVLFAEYPELKGMVEAEQLEWMGSRTTGALSFFSRRAADEVPLKGFNELWTVRHKALMFLEKLQAMGLEQARNPAVASHGGAMPKASFEDADGRHWIAKFDRPGDASQLTHLEHLASQMAERCGVSVPKTMVLKSPEGGPVFLSERYDRQKESRTHRISMMTLCNKTDISRGDYAEMFAVLKQVVDPAEWPQQREEMLRRLMVNVGLNVTDDHLRNHELLLDTKTGYWRLAPAYDLVPVPDSGPHQCSVFGQARANLDVSSPEGMELWVKVAKALEMPPARVLEMADTIRDTIAREWPALVFSSEMSSVAQKAAVDSAERGCALQEKMADISRQARAMKMK